MKYEIFLSFFYYNGFFQSSAPPPPRRWLFVHILARGHYLLEKVSHAWLCITKKRIEIVEVIVITMQCDYLPGSSPVLAPLSKHKKDQLTANIQSSEIRMISYFDKWENNR